MIATLIREILPESYRPIGYLTHLTQRRTGLRIRSGPFTGMRYGPAAAGSAYIPKLLGIYERELASIIEQVCSRLPGWIVDIGAAEGYYAVGLAIRNPQAHVVAFETEQVGRDLLRRSAQSNRVADQIEINGHCEQPDLERSLSGVQSPIVVCDVEGHEYELLDPGKVPSLLGASVLVELHDFIRPGVSQLLRERFAPSHLIRHILQEPRSRDEFPWRTLGTALLPSSYLDWAVSEWRPEPMSWYWMEPTCSRIPRANS
jgi:hypothetical protein